MKKALANGCRITTNGHMRDTLTYDELAKKWQEEHDYAAKEHSGTYVLYRGWCHNLDEFQLVADMRPELVADGWHGIAFDSYSSGTLIKVGQGDYGDQVIMGWFY